MNETPNHVNEADASGRIQSVDRAMQLVNAVAASLEPETAPVLAERCGLNRSTTWRILATLEHHGVVERDPETNRYSLGYAILRLASAAGSAPLVRRAHPLLRRLAEQTGETVNLAVARHLELVYSDQVQAPHVMAPNWMGHAVPLHATSTGKAFLAALPEEELELVLRHPLERYTETTLTDAKALARELDGVRRSGFAVSHGELETALWGVSAAARDERGQPAAVVSVWGTESRVRDRLDELGGHATRAARELEALLAGD